jgi:hypothetical protein
MSSASHSILDSEEAKYVRGSSKSSNGSYDDGWAFLSLLIILGTTLGIAIIVKLLSKAEEAAISTKRSSHSTELLSVELIKDDD